MRRVIGVFLSIFILVSSAHANCEAGGFFIHTVATYHNNPMFQFLVGGSTATQLSATSELLNSLIPDGKYELVNAPENCTSVSLKFNKAKDLDSKAYFLSGCPSFTAQTENLFFVNVAKKTITVGKAINISKSVSENISTRDEIKKTINKMSFKAEEDDDKTIDKKDIINLSDFMITHTFAGNNFHMSIALLEIKNLPNYYRLYDMFQIPEGKMPEAQKAFAEMTALYPVIFFTEKQKTRYIGDGANCSSKSVKDLASYQLGDLSSKTFQKQLGAIYKFEITSAYDINNDGEPDIITVNNYVSYWLKADGTILVINSQFSC